RYGIRREAGLRRHDDQPALAQRAAAPRKLPAEVAVDVHDPLLELTLEEQPRLHLAVRAHVAVIVDVIAAQVGEERRIKLHAVDAVLLERVRGDLDRRRLRAAIREPGELAVQLDARGRRERALLERRLEA